ncbi:hypothetical protein DAT35_30140 [Vitiosangium sp. GDMCC 1.1324]|nr:hypothetical protein DAT35_30140 [Vitiosangium sp. GDMCC 1.1324]
MFWMVEWKAWSARYEAIAALVQLYVQAGTFATFADLAGRQIIPQLVDQRALLVGFRDRFASQLPPDAARSLQKHLQGQLAEQQFDAQGAAGLPGALRLLGALAMVKAEIDFCLADKGAHAVRASERAFEHLQRSLIADEDVHAKWRRAFDVGEVACEKLGAVHMLLHGIWAFKANAEGGRTDLILGDSVRDADAARSSDAMVLTEWKMVRDGDDANDSVRTAFRQAERYSRDTLAGFELSTHRYLVLVSLKKLTPIPEAPRTDKCLYVVRNIAVEPLTPSMESRAG